MTKDRLLKLTAEINRFAAEDIKKHLNFSGFERKAFPESECTEPDKREKGIYKASTNYVCYCIDSRFKDQAYVRILIPYVYKESKEVFYGWEDKDGNIFGHFEKEVNIEDQIVIAWKKI